MGGLHVIEYLFGFRGYGDSHGIPMGIRVGMGWIWGLKCHPHGSPGKSSLRVLDPIQNQALRLCLGAFRTSPATSLHVEANEMPMELRRRTSKETARITILAQDMLKYE